MRRSFNFFSFLLLFGLGIATVVFNSCGRSSSQSPTSDKGVVINGVKWATCNVDKPGTFAAKPEDEGMLYQWNRKVGWSANRPMINSNGNTEWDESMPIGNTWEKANDPSPVGWRIPTQKELETLLNTDKVSHVMINDNNNRMRGIRFTDKTTGNSIFLPFVCIRNHFGDLNDDARWLGIYWSSNPIDRLNAYYLYFNMSTELVKCSAGSRHYGYSIRCVAE